jgi:hypothetical protein
MRSRLAAACFIATGVIVLATPAARGQAEPPYYPNQVKASADPTRDIGLTRDAAGAVRAYFEKFRRTSSIVEGTRDGEHSVSFIATVSIQGGPPAPLTLVSISERLPNSVVAAPFQQLQSLVGRYGHTQAEFDALAKRYGDVRRAYFREVDTDDGPMPEGEAIFKKYELQIFGPDEDVPDSADDEKRADELDKKMEALEAKGDIAGMAALARQAQAETAKTPAAQAAARKLAAMNRDNWAAWVKCLDELKAAGYLVQITYGGAFGNHW